MSRYHKNYELDLSTMSSKYVYDSNNLQVLNDYIVPWPKDVGIVNIAAYFPSLFVDQSELEEYDGVPKGKYTLGLGQTTMSFCSDREDIQSFCLTVTHQLIEDSKISFKDIGLLIVGSETWVDKSKSIKSTLMQLFEESGNCDIEGVDVCNACYGGTAALFSAINWIESSSWDGRYAIAVAADIAVYDKGPARPTGGAGAIAMLIGPNAPLVLIRKCRSTFMAHTYDFYKPKMESEYPIVDGKESIACYTRAIDKCYSSFNQKYKRILESEDDGQQKSWKNFSFFNHFNGFLFHSPYCKLVQKSLARLMLNEFVQDDNPDYVNVYKGLEKYHSIKLEETYFDKDLEKEFIKISEEVYLKKSCPSLFLATMVGNMYTASLYFALVSYLFSEPIEVIAGNRILLFSYGSGMASSMFAIQITKTCSPNSPLHLLHERLKKLPLLLKQRTKVSPKEYNQTLEQKEKTHLICPYIPSASIETLFPGTYYLVSIDESFKRRYQRVEKLTKV